MPHSFVTIDTSDDFDMAPPTVQSNNAAKRTLLLAPPSFATQEEKLRDLFTTFDRSTSDLQMLDRLSAGFVSLPSNTYDLVLVLTDTDGTRRSEALPLLTRELYTALVPAMKAGSKLQTQDNIFGASESREAVLAGLVPKEGGFEKPDTTASVAVPLRFGAKKAAAKKNVVPPPPPPVIDFTDDLGKDDELIDEDTLLSEEDLKRPVVPPPECQPKAGKRRRACKDCTCGLAAQLEAEDAERRANADQGLNTLKLQADDLNELDFTVQGKTGSCGNCALGDAFRCAGCPYIGMPAFKPGEEVKILNEAQL
ncbi:electron carrier [Paecilomyces lecythidis]